MNNTIYSGGIPVPLVDDSKQYFKSKLTILFGPSGSGKSTLIQHILNSLRESIPLVVVCCPTASLNGDYNNIVPDQCIHDDVTKPLMQKIFQRQENVMAMYDLVRNITHIKPLYKKIATRESNIKVDKLTTIYRKACEDIRNTYDEEDVDSTINEFTIKYNKKLVKIMRGQIINEMPKLKSLSLTDMEKTILSNFEINPAILILIDDCMASVREWSQLEETKKLFYQGRHYFVTCLISAQNETSIPPAFRMNAHISVFTTQTIVNTYINKASSGISPDERKRISKIAETIFAPSEDRARPNYKKLIIFGAIVKTDHRVQYIIGSTKKKRFGSSALWAMCKHVERATSSTVSSNSFSKMFSLKSTPSLDPIPQS